jgi:soluble lytic murein transglycosylase-like protein
LRCLRHRHSGALSSRFWERWWRSIFSTFPTERKKEEQRKKDFETAQRGIRLNLSLPELSQPKRTEESINKTSEPMSFLTPPLGLNKYVWEMIPVIAQTYGLETALVAAIVRQESNGNRYAVRYEPGWKYHLDPGKWANKIGCSVSTEMIGQSTSYGLMQVMGTVAREYGFKGWFPQLCEIETGLKYGCQHLRKYFDKWGSEENAISAYNQGSPAKTNDGVFKNKKYVDEVLLHKAAVNRHLIS